MEQDADATSTEDPALENQDDSQVADAASMEQDTSEASAEEAQVRLEITSMDPIEASSEEASMPDAMELPENDESERVENNGIKLMTVDIYSSEPEKSSVPEHSSPEDSVSQLSQEENQALEKYRVKLYVDKSDVLYRVVDVPLVVVPTPMQAPVVCQVHERGHFEATRTEALLRRDFWFKGMRQKLEKVIRRCVDRILAEHEKP